MDLSELRQSYTKGEFGESDLLGSPFAQFEKWFREAESAELEEPNAMCTATATPQGQPSTRIVLLKDFSDKGLVFYTNYESRKSSELEANPKAAANFLWLPFATAGERDGFGGAHFQGGVIEVFSFTSFGQSVGCVDFAAEQGHYLAADFGGEAGADEAQVS